MTQSNHAATIDWKANLRDESKQLRITFLQHINSPEFWNEIEDDPDLFHEALVIAKNLGFIHYTRIAAVMKMKDPSAASRWFTTNTDTRKTPEWVRRQNAVQALSNIIAHDVRRLSAGESPIGFLSVKDEPELGVSMFEKVDFPPARLSSAA